MARHLVLVVSRRLYKTQIHWIAPDTKNTKESIFEFVNLNNLDLNEVKRFTIFASFPYQALELLPKLLATFFNQHKLKGAFQWHLYT